MSPATGDHTKPQGTASAKSRQFLFVSGTLGSSKEEARSHVAKLSYRPKESRTTIKAQVNIPLGWIKKSEVLTPDPKPQTSSQHHLEKRRSAKHRTTISINDTQTSKSVSNRTSPAAIEDEEAIENIKCYSHRQEMAILKTSYISPLSIVGNGQSDPFGSSCITINSEIAQLLQLSREHYVRSKWAAEGSDHETASAVTIWNEDIQDAMTSSAVLHSTFAVAAQYTVMASDCSEEKKAELSKKSLYHSVQAIAGIRQSLKNNVLKESVITAILNLAAFDGYCGRGHLTHAAHMKAIKQIAESAGGFSNLSERIRHSAGIIDTAGSFVLFRPLSLNLDDWDPGFWAKQPLSQKYTSASLLPFNEVKPDLVALHYDETPYPFMRQILNNLHEILSVWNIAVATSDRPDRSEMFKWITIRRAAVKAYILKDYHETKVYERVSSSKFNLANDMIAAATCQVALAFSGFVMYPASTVLVHRPIPSQDMVKNVMKLIHTESFTNRPGLFLWLSFGGFTIEHLSKKLGFPADENFFIDIFSGIAKVLKIQTWQQVKDYLKVFLHDDSLDSGLVLLFEKYKMRENEPL